VTPTDFRDKNFAALRESLPAMRLQVWGAWCSVRQGTTRDVARLSGIDILGFRPRTTELVEAGLVCLVDSCPGGIRGMREGIYRARTEEEWQQWMAAQFPVAGQLQML
jgi:hypothetical protein